MAWLTATGAVVAQGPSTNVVPLPSTNVVQATDTNHAPRIVCASPEYNFGTAVVTQMVTHEFILRNEGDLNLEISNVRSSCGCTVANITSRSVPPGGETKVTAALSLAGRTGMQHKTVTVDSNDPHQPSLLLTLKGEVAVNVKVQPERVLWDRLSATDAASAEVLISASDQQPFIIQSTQPSSTNLEVTVTTVETNMSYKLVISTKPPLPEGVISANVRVLTTHPQRPVIDIPVTSQVLGDLVAAPPIINISAQGPQPVTTYIIVRSPAGRPFEVVSVEPPLPSIAVQKFPFGSNGYRIQLANIQASMELHGKVVKITTDVPSKREITVPINVLNPIGPLP
jgi:hypothetical protein